MSEKGKQGNAGEQGRNVRVRRLDTVGKAAAEMGMIYKMVRRGEIEVVKGSKLIQMLAEIRRALRDDEVDKRIDELEAKLGLDDGIGAANVHRFRA